MSGVFQNVDPPPPQRPVSVCVSPRLWCGGRTHSLGGGGWGFNSSEDARHCSVLLHVSTYFVPNSMAQNEVKFLYVIFYHLK
jgi:hypothetical protein